MGIAIQIRTLSFVGGCVVIATTRQTPALSASTVADSMVVFGSATAARLSHNRTGLALATTGFGGVCISGGGAGRPAGAPPRPGGCVPRAWPAVTSRATAAAESSGVRFTRFIIAQHSANAL